MVLPTDPFEVTVGDAYLLCLAEAAETETGDFDSLMEPGLKKGFDSRVPFPLVLELGIG